MRQHDHSLKRFITCICSFEDPASVNYTKFLKEGLAKAESINKEPVNGAPSTKTEL